MSDDEVGSIRGLINFGDELLEFFQSRTFKIWLKQLPLGGKLEVALGVLFALGAVALGVWISNLLAFLPLVPAILFFLIAWRTHPYKKPEPHYDFFATIGLRNTDEKEKFTFLPRTSILAGLETWLQQNKGSSGVLLITGESGTGKSVLVRYLLPHWLRKGKGPNSSTVVITACQNPEAFKTAIYDGLLEHKATNIERDGFLESPRFSLESSKDPQFLILDEFEEALAPLTSDLVFGEWLRDLINNWLDVSINQYCVIVFRKEFLADLLALSTKGIDILAHNRKRDERSNIMFITGINFCTADETGDVRHSLRQLEKVVGNPHVMKRITTELKESKAVLPLEIQMIGYVLEDLKHQKNLSLIDLDQYDQELGGRVGLVRRYFLRFIESTGAEQAASALLYALSYSRRSQSRSAESIIRATHRDKHQIEKLLKELVTCGLIVEDKEGSYRMTHNYLAEAFAELSVTQLDPSDRDNIQYFAGLESSRIEQIKKMQRWEWRNGIDVVYFLLLVGILLRLLLPPWHFDESAMIASLIGGVVPTVPVVIPNSLIDWRYLPSFIASAGCGFYTWQLFRNFLVRIPDAEAITIITVIITFLMITGGAVFPHFWLLFAGIAGLMMAGRLRACYSKSGVKWLLRSRNPLVKTTRYVGLNMFIASIMGLGLGWLRYKYTSLNSLLGYLLELPTALIVSTTLLMAWTGHAAKAQGEVYFGLWDRMRLIAKGTKMK